MSSPLSVREMNEKDIALIVNYWLHSDPLHLQRMGVALAKIPTEAQLSQMLSSQLALPVEQKRAYCIIWQLDGNPIGHCNTNPTTYGEEAYMHLHIWMPDIRRMGHGLQLLKLTLPYFFDHLQLKRLYCQPYALNDAPNKTLKKLGFEFEEEYITTPGSLNFEQPVKKWLLTAERFKQILLIERS